MLFMIASKNFIIRRNGCLMQFGLNALQLFGTAHALLCTSISNCLTHIVGGDDFVTK